MNKVIFSSEVPDELLASAGKLFTYFDGDTLVKNAASSAFSEKLIKTWIPDKDHFGIHLIAMGASEYYGFNKNGDYWPKKMLVRCHPTFVSHGNLFREHLNQDPKKRIGLVKASAYNDELERVELIVWGNKIKAEDEYQKAKAGKELSFSMSARVPYDVCSCCDVKAKRSKDYCTHLKNSMTQWIEKYSRFAYAINEDGTFFDISKVKNPADRIAHYLEYFFGKEEGMAKAASADGHFLFSDQRAEAEGLFLPDTHNGFLNSDTQRMLVKLAAEERYVQAFYNTPQNVSRDAKFHFTKEAAMFAFNNDATTEAQLQALRAVEPTVMLRFMAEKSASLPFKTFYAYASKKTLAETSNDPIFKYASVKLLPGIFSNLLESSIDPEMESLFEVASSVKSAHYAPSDSIQKMLDGVAQDYTVDQPALKIRIIRNCATRPGSVKIASEDVVDLSDTDKAQALKLATAYGIYKVAFCKAITYMHGQESIDDAIALLLACQHT